MNNEGKAKLRKRLRSNIALMLAFVIVTMFGALVMRNQLLDNAREINLSLLDSYALNEENIMSTYKHLLKVCAQFIEEKQSEGASIDEIKSGLYPYFAGFNDWYSGDSLRAIAIIDGKVLSNDSSIEGHTDETYNYREADWYIGAMQSDGKVFMTDVYRDEETGNTEVTLAKKIEGIDGVILFELFFADYHTEKDALDLPENGAYYLCDPKGTVAYSQTHVFDNYDDMQSFASSMLGNIDDTTQHGYVEGYYDARGEKRSAFMCRLNNGWSLIYTIPHKNAVGDMEEYYLAIGGTFVLGMFIIIFLAIRVYRREKTNQRLREERSSLEQETQIYQKTMSSAILAYREVCYFDLVEETYRMVYPKKVRRKKTGNLREGIRYVIDNEILTSDDMKSLEEFLSISNLKKELRNKEYIETRCCHKDSSGKDENCVITVTVADRINGKPTGVTMLIRSIEEVLEKEKMQRELLTVAAERAEAASNAKSDFLSNVSHDIRTPMNAILGMTAIAAIHIDDKERVRDALNKITVSGKHLLGLINSVLDMSKIESGKISLNEEEFKLSDSIENLIMLFNSQIKAKNLDLKVNIVNIEHEYVIGDDQRLQQIFINILGNAVKFTPEGGMISINICEKKSDVSDRACYEFVFTDTGIGMTNEFLNVIFEPFARASDTRTSHTEGTGLGMPIAVNIARMMGGDIHVESEVGKGSEFTVTVYLKTASGEDEDLSELAQLPVLVVDDEKIACESACEILNSMELRAEYVLSGDAAIERVKEAHKGNEDFSLIILDWKMPDKDGIETAREIRKIMGDEIPIIILSAYDWTEVEQEALNAGVNAFIEKPLFKSRLTRVLKDVFGIRHAKERGTRIEAFSKCNYSGKRALIVEDNELNIEVAEEILKSAGFEIETAYNGKEAVEKVLSSEKSYYDLIFMDIQMPIMNGYEATKAIRGSGREDLEKLPIIAMTADAFTDDVNRAKAAGMNGHVAKPIDVNILGKIIDECLNK
jgi:signal transduction histidine kinase/DNA-binding response OmpR family regulator